MVERHPVGMQSHDRHEPYPEPVDSDGYNHGIDILVDHDYDAREGMLSLADAARRAGVTRSAVLRWIRSGYLPAETSTDGWMIHAQHLDAARDADERSRLGIGMDEIAHEPVNTNRVDTISTVALRTFPSPRPFEPLSESLVSPLAELIRDQTDVVQDQAETIGWLQSELRRMREHLSELEAAASASADVDDEEPAGDEQPASVIDNTSMVFEQATDSDQAQEFFAIFAEPPAKTSDQELDSFEIDVSSVDVFSDEAARARMAIEETERRINELWREQGLHTGLRATPADPEPVDSEPVATDRSWVRRVFTPWQRS